MKNVFPPSYLPFQGLSKKKKKKKKTIVHMFPISQNSGKTPFSVFPSLRQLFTLLTAILVFLYGMFSWPSFAF